MQTPDQDDPPAGVPGNALFSLSQIRHLMRVEFSRAQRYRYPLAVLVIAVDRLRTLRELHGFEAAAELRTRLVALLESGARVCDYLGRLVDDRLVLVLPHADRAGVEAAAKRYLEGARKEPLRLPAGDLRISLSIGAALYDGGAEVLFFESLLERAEAACAAAAAAGGDRLELVAAGGAEVRP
jgi:diguanylate cyclase (GGDEF)-like protein